MLYPQVMVDIVKIGVLLSTRIFLLPCVVGFVIYQCWNTFLFGYETALLVDFCINNVIGTVAVLWGMGISFMLYSTIAILQLREILHPSFLARFIRPQESQSDLLTSLLQGKVNIEEPDMMSKKKFYTSSHDFIPLSLLSHAHPCSLSLWLSRSPDSTPIQMKRLVISFFVYSLLIGAFVFIPLQLALTLGGALQRSPLHGSGSVEWLGAVLRGGLEVRTHYLAPELQIPLEVGLLHTSFLMFLEKFKDVIGTCEFYTLVFLSKHLGLNRFLLPYTYKKIASLSEEVQSLKDLSPSLQHLYRHREVLALSGSLVVVCAEPMLRPPGKNMKTTCTVLHCTELKRYRYLHTTHK